MALQRKTYRLSTDMALAITAAARRKGIGDSEYVREAVAYQLGRDSSRSEIAELQADNERRVRQLERKFAMLAARVERIARQMRW